jgi:hypothetical protein
LSSLELREDFKLTTKEYWALQDALFAEAYRRKMCAKPRGKDFSRVVDEAFEQEAEFRNL